eukprot:746391-Hanusia_phi.AAC.14
MSHQQHLLLMLVLASCPETRFRNLGDILTGRARVSDSGGDFLQSVRGRKISCSHIRTKAKGSRGLNGMRRMIRGNRLGAEEEGRGKGGRLSRPAGVDKERG